MRPDFETTSEAQYFPCGCFYKVRVESGEVVQLEARVCSVCFDDQFDRLQSPIDEDGQLTLHLPSREGRPPNDYAD